MLCAICVCPVAISWWRHQMEAFPPYRPFVRGIHRSPVNSPHKGQWRGALMVSLIYAWINDWINNRKAGDLGRHRAHYDGTVMLNEKYATAYMHTAWRYGLIISIVHLSCWHHDMETHSDRPHRPSMDAPHKRKLMRSFDIFLTVRLNKL